MNFKAYVRRWFAAPYLAVTVVVCSLMGSPVGGQELSTKASSVTGQVKLSDSGAPVSQAVLRLRRLEDEAPSSGAQPVQRLPVLSLRSDDQGRFSFQDVAIGTHQLTVTADDFFPLDGSPLSPEGSGKRVAVSAGQVVTGITIYMARAGRVEGTVLDEAGDPAVGVQLMFAQSVFAAGRSRLVPIPTGASKRTDDRGAFRVSRLPPGDYYLLALSAPFGVDGTKILAPPTTDSTHGFQPTFYPGTPLAADARAIHVQPGAEVSGINFAMVPAKQVSLTGSVTDENGKRQQSGSVQLLQVQDGDVRIPIPANARLNADGSFEFAFVPAGEYVLQVRAPSGFGASLISVRDRAVRDVVVTTVPSRTIRGRIVFEDGVPPPTKAIQLTVRPTDYVLGPAVGSGLSFAVISDDWSFELPNVSVIGVLRGWAPSGWTMSSVLIRGKDATDVPYPFRDENLEGVEVVFSRGTAAALVTLSDTSRSVEDQTVPVFSDNPAKWNFPSRHVAVGRTDAKGYWKASGLPPGNYLAIAAPWRLPPGGDVDPELLVRVRPFATPVYLAGNESTTLALKIVAIRF